MCLANNEAANQNNGSNVAVS